ncbi:MULTISPECIES: hypothetical protein [Microbacterium]|uniref:Uncharacterized protein n=1 Tax=Microbacterium wangchenii TaxID=2541726 RepID=A0ABX5SYZ7_9MICO|nr:MULTISPECIES: hypothetical protein [Microbacterium]MCK6068490.1 hypothetical protein [Microbacterium sp. EYE_512]QBR90039.1 hypothetical protein E4K62_15915 [Microbacterium wangchenii]TFV85109.1 hypothetical protein E4V99_08845 [Microbacterium sp. dk485]TXK09241.1 hypothetical protein FVP99_17885 [Microbacterium wangchenii]
MTDVTPEQRSRTLVLFPEWGGEDRVPMAIELPVELRQRIRAWNLTWQTVLDPVFEVRWPDPEVGRRWIEEGNALVRALQDELGPSISVVGDFMDYDPAG